MKPYSVVYLQEVTQAVQAPDLEAAAAYAKRYAAHNGLVVQTVRSNPALPPAPAA